MAVDLKNERDRKFVVNMLVMRALTPVLDAITQEQYAEVHDAVAVAMEEISRMTLTHTATGMSVHSEPGTPGQEAAGAILRKSIEDVLDG